MGDARGATAEAIGLRVADRVLWHQEEALKQQRLALSVPRPSVERGQIALGGFPWGG
jgi:hypothetical protein